MISNLNRSTFMGHLGADAKQANGTAPVTFSHRCVFALDRQRGRPSDAHRLAEHRRLREPPQVCGEVEEGRPGVRRGRSTEQQLRAQDRDRDCEVLRDGVPCRRHRAGCGQGRERTAEE